MPEPLDIADMLVSTVAAIDTAISVADATDADLPLVYINPAFERLTGYRHREVVGRNGRFMHGPETDRDTVIAIGESLRRGDFTQARLVNYRADGSAFWVDLHISPVRDDDGTVIRFAAVHHDVTAERAAQQEAVRVAARDPLTTLTTRALFVEELKRELARAHRSGTAAAVLFLDVDDFKAVNDTYGHLVGDGFLIHVAECLRQRLRGQDACARVGGDEFTALLTDLPGDGVAAAERVVTDLHNALAGSFTVDGVEHHTKVSIGTALYPRDGATVRDLLAAADANMYAHKPPRTTPRERRHVTAGAGRGRLAPRLTSLSVTSAANHRSPKRSPTACFPCARPRAGEDLMLVLDEVERRDCRPYVTHGPHVDANAVPAPG